MGFRETILPLLVRRNSRGEDPRLTPGGWLAVGLLALAIFGSVSLGVRWLGGPVALLTSVGVPGETAHSAPSTVIKDRCPDSWSLVPRPGIAGETFDVDPPCVADEVLADFDAAMEWWLNNPRAMPEEAERYFTDSLLTYDAAGRSQNAPMESIVRNQIETRQVAGQYVRVDLGASRTRRIATFLAEGQQALVMDRRPDGATARTFLAANPEPIDVRESTPHLVLYTLGYDRQDGRWKIGASARYDLTASEYEEMFEEIWRYMNP